MKIDQVYIDTDEVAVGFDPERADISNPVGAIYNQLIQIYATTSDGRRFIHSRSFNTVESELANKLVRRIKDAGCISPEHWCETYEIYGSDAWCAADREREIVHQSNPDTAGTIRDY